uniref:Uncharacterized protein LOC104249173 n=1 Tax=Nicotiana sylvestris TaxID=4096 RepID=A0A1U7YXF5_NICSY|nr:PREDICTED: uncharacterized protein LOC104249173 [Nicotiana sylvestris]
MKVNDKPIRVMIDTGATYNYLASTQVEHLGLVVGKRRGRIKAINSPPQPAGGITKGVPVMLGPYEGKFNLRVVIIDDFELIVGLEFMSDVDKTPKESHALRLGSQASGDINALKVAMSSSLVLALPNLAIPFEVQMVAFDYALGGVFLQEGHPIAYERRKLKDVEWRYASHKKELLIVVHFLLLWRNYLLVTPFVVNTDNTAVIHFTTQPKPNGCQARWQELLAEFHFNLESQSGKTNQRVDALSQRADLASSCLVSTLRRSEVTTTIRDQIQNLLPKDPVAQYLVYLVKGNQLYVPKGGYLRRTILMECHDTLWDGHPSEEHTMTLLRRAYYCPQIVDDVAQYVKTSLICQKDKSDRLTQVVILELLLVP